MIKCYVEINGKNENSTKTIIRNALGITRNYRHAYF